MTFDWHEVAKQQWDEKAKYWHEKSKANWDTGSRSTILPFFSQYVPKDVRVLDIGCGDGYGTYVCSEAGYKMYGVDLSMEMIKFAKNRGECENLIFAQADLTALPFPNDSFAAVLAINILEWTENPLQALQEMHRILQPNGKACIAILGPTAAPRMNSYRRLYGESVICNTMMPWEFSHLAQENGFSVLDSKGVYKRGVDEQMYLGLPIALQQALTFLWIFMLEKQ